MLALHAYQGAICGGCGGHLPDTTAEGAESAYVATLPIRCHRCTAIAIRAEAYREQPQSTALLYPVEHRKAGEQL